MSGARTSTQVLRSTICCRCLGLELVPSDKKYDLLHGKRGTICYGHWVLHLVISYTRGGTICYGHWGLRLVISDTRQGVRFVTGIGICVLWYHTRDSGYDLLRALDSDRGYDLLQALHSAFCDITHETGGTICYRHWILRLVISHTRQRLELVPKC